jgi:hypothetical protein
MDSFLSYRSVVYLSFFMFYLPLLLLIYFAAIVAAQSTYAVVSDSSSPFALFVSVSFHALNCRDTNLKLNTFVTTVGQPRSCLS